VLAGRLGLAVFPIWSRRNPAAVFGVEALATAAGRGTGRGTILAMPLGGMSLDVSASCRSTNAVFIGSMGAVRLDGPACVSICSGDATIPAVVMVCRGCGSTRCATSLTPVPGDDGWGAAPEMEPSRLFWRALCRSCERPVWGRTL
jgi:hypothetical protein